MTPAKVTYFPRSGDHFASFSASVTHSSVRTSSGSKLTRSRGLSEAVN
jgi:hypothetical protein